MNSKQISFTNPDSGHQLAGIIDLPEKAQPRGWALFAHCFTCGKNLKSTRHISRALTRQQMGVLRFDFTGLGDSQGDFASSHLSSNIGDLVAAANWLKQNAQGPDILIGHSFGGAAVLQATSLIPAVRAVVTIAAPFDPKHVTHLLNTAMKEIKEKGSARVDIAGRSFTLGKEFVADLATHKSEERIRKLGRPLLVLHSPGDPVVDIDNARLIFQAARHPKSFISLDHTDHLLSKEADALYVGELIACWASRYLGADKE
ncbi:MAG: alpha/beta hydrolase [Desulfuromonadales bacterium]|nr:alpha/beta hydrolase [Desulfuromonadales bacterium]